MFPSDDALDGAHTEVFTFLLGVKAQTPNTKAPWAGARQGAPLLTSRGQKGAQTSCLATVVVPDFEPLTRRQVPIQWYCIQVSSHPGAQESLTAPFPQLTQAVTMYHQLNHWTLICGQSITPHYPDAGPHFTAWLKKTTPGCFPHLSPHLLPMEPSRI